VLAAVVYPFWSLLADSILGAGFAMSLYLVAVTSLYVAGCGPHWTRGIVAGAVAGFLGMLLLSFAWRTSEVAIGAAFILGVCRSVIIWRPGPVRGLVVEFALVTGGLLFARVVNFPGPLGAAFSIWAFFLLQSVFFLLPGAEPRRNDSAPGLDPFDQARARAMALLDDEAG
jgi:hypothetical protein